MDIFCTFQDQNFYDGPYKVKPLYTCCITSAAITKVRVHINSIEGTHIAGKGDIDVQAVNISGGNIRYFPRGLHKIFPNLIFLNIDNCGLTEIFRSDLRGLETLCHLWIQRTALISLPNDLLTRMENLKSVVFNNNQLECLSSKLFTPIVKNCLAKVDFRGNKSINSQFEPGAAETVTSLQELCTAIDTNCKEPTLIEREETSEGFPDRIMNGCKELWQSGRFTDFVITIGSKEFKVHKNILGFQSSYFAKMFETEMKEKKTGRLEIKGFCEDSVEEMLAFLYTGKCPTATNSQWLHCMTSQT